jgi:hypothetical protein
VFVYICIACYMLYLLMYTYSMLHILSAYRTYKENYMSIVICCICIACYKSYLSNTIQQVCGCEREAHSTGYVCMYIYTSGCGGGCKARSIGHLCMHTYLISGVVQDMFVSIYKSGCGGGCKARSTRHGCMYTY